MLAIFLVSSKKNTSPSFIWTSFCYLLYCKDFAVPLKNPQKCLTILKTNRLDSCLVTQTCKVIYCFNSMSSKILTKVFWPKWGYLACACTKNSGKFLLSIWTMLFELIILTLNTSLYLFKNLWFEWGNEAWPRRIRSKFAITRLEKICQIFNFTN